jgi:hypothetical protein
MAFDKEYPNRKDQRKKYRKSASFDRSCRTGGDCPWCKSNRTHKSKRREPLEEKEKE